MPTVYTGTNELARHVRERNRFGLLDLPETSPVRPTQVLPRRWSIRVPPQDAGIHGGNARTSNELEDDARTLVCLVGLAVGGLLGLGCGQIVVWVAVRLGAWLV